MPHKEGSRTYSLRFESFYLHISTLGGSGVKETSGPNLGAQDQSDEPSFCCARNGWALLGLGHFLFYQGMKTRRPRDLVKLANKSTRVN